MPDSLTHILKQVGHELAEVTLSGGGRALLLPFGGRILGLFSPGSEENFFWTNPALCAVETAREFFARPGWPNTGGDRTWLAPERELFISDLTRAWETYCVPAAVDPGRYVLKAAAGGLRLVTTAVVTRLQTGQSAEVEIIRSIQPTPNPLQQDSTLGPDVEYAGYTRTVSLSFTESLQVGSPALALWSLLQLPHGGELFLPTSGQAQFAVQFGQVAESDCNAELGLLRYHMNAKGIQKIGVRSDAVTGRAAYLREMTADRSELVVSNFDVQLSGEYIDVPWDAPNEEGYCFQACNISDPAFGHFSEIEYHIPSIGGRTGQKSCTDSSQVWAFRGSKASIGRVMQQLLGQTVCPTHFDSSSAHMHR